MEGLELVELSVNYLSKKLGYTREEAKEEGIPIGERRADIIRDGESIKVIPKSHPDNMPLVEIRNPVALEKALSAYMQTVQTKQIEYTKPDKSHGYKHFLFNIWKNATSSDCVSPEQFVYRYINFINDDTFSEFDRVTPLGKCNDDILLVKRRQDKEGFETPYIMHLAFSDGTSIYNLPWIRYGISTNKAGEKLAYIYALQRMDECPNDLYNSHIRQLLNKVNSGVKNYRNVTPSAIAALSIFLGMLEAQGISCIKAPDFLRFRYGKYRNAHSMDEQDRIQENLTEKFLRNFLRLSDQLSNLSIQSVPNDELNSFLCMVLNPYDGSCKNETLKKFYELGLGKSKAHLFPSKENDREL